MSISIGMMVGGGDFMSFGTRGRRSESSPESRNHLRKPVIRGPTVSLAMNRLDKIYIQTKTN
jgi:hypothetical protein